MEENQTLDIIEIGKRIKQVRIELLGLSQAEFAQSIGASQLQISRMETGIGATFELILRVVNYLNQNGYNAYAILVDNFDLSMMTGGPFDAEIMINYLQHMKENTINEFNLLIGKAKLM